MRFFNNEITMHVDVPDGSTSTVDVLFGIHVMEGECESCGEPVIGIQLGFIFFTITITIEKPHT